MAVRPYKRGEPPTLPGGEQRYQQDELKRIEATGVQVAEALSDLEADIATLNAAVATKAPLASPVFTGDPMGPTPSAGDNDTSLATTAFVINELTRPNALIEGGFDIWQRGTSFANNNGAALFTADRWKVSRGAVAGAAWTASRQAASSLPTRYKLRVQRTAANASTQLMLLYTAISYTVFRGKVRPTADHY